MKIGIKYCGGCQSKYNRTKVVDKIKKKYAEYDFEYVRDGEIYDYIIVINGCQIKCADVSKYIAKNEIVWIDSPDISILEKILVKR
ncbi:hypothetical protein [uncultured Anaerococcus sp.]|uniref:hypothetical protein n=1 Tax=uncultured Anaerococcus sp. TaxID=293428 RepID=UPI00262F09BD|nr:hypothetical protein [uncultured Anaerococcus sp.]